MVVMCCPRFETRCRSGTCLFDTYLTIHDIERRQQYNHKTMSHFLKRSCITLCNTKPSPQTETHPQPCLLPVLNFREFDSRVESRVVIVTKLRSHLSIIQRIFTSSRNPSAEVLHCTITSIPSWNPSLLTDLYRHKLLAILNFLQISWHPMASPFQFKPGPFSRSHSTSPVYCSNMPTISPRLETSEYAIPIGSPFCNYSLAS